MKIKFNDFESLDIQIKATYEFDEFHQLVQRFNQIDKLGRKDFMIDSSLEGTYEPKEKISNDGIEYFKNGKPKKGSLNTQAMKQKQIASSGVGRGHKRLWCDTREKCIKILKLHYFGNDTQKEKFAKENNLSWQNDIVKVTDKLKNRHNIKPSDVGLKDFPRHRGKQRAIEIQQLKI